MIEVNQELLSKLETKFQAYTDASVHMAKAAQALYRVNVIEAVMSAEDSASYALEAHAILCNIEAVLRGQDPEADDGEGAE